METIEQAPVVEQPVTTVETPATPERPASQTSPNPPKLGLQDMTPTERKQWRKDGTVPDRTKADQPAEAAAAPSGEQTASKPEAKKKEAAPVAVEPKKAPQSKLSATERANQLAEENARLNEQLRLRKQIKAELAGLDLKPKDEPKADPSPAASDAQKDYEKLLKSPGAPKWQDFEDMDAYTAAMAAFITENLSKQTFDKMFAERSAHAAQQASEAQAMDATLKVAGDRLAADEQAHPELKGAVHQDFLDLVPARMIPAGQKVGPHHFAKDLILFESEHPLQLGAYFSKDENQAEWDAMMQLDGAGIRRAIAYRDVSFRGKASAPKPAGAPAKKFTTAPAPPAELGNRPASVVDGAEQAVKAGDFRAFMREMDAKEGKQSRYSR